MIWRLEFRHIARRIRTVRAPGAPSPDGKGKADSLERGLGAEKWRGLAAIYGEPGAARCRVETRNGRE